MMTAIFKYIIANKFILVVKSHRQSLYVLMYNVYKSLAINDLLSSPVSAVRPNRLLRASLVAPVAAHCRRGVLAVGYYHLLSILVSAADHHKHGVLRVVD